VERRARSDAWFDGLVRDVEPGLRHALVAVYGQEQGRDATAEALAYAWEHRTESGWQCDRPANHGGDHGASK